MNQLESLAAFVTQAHFENLSPQVLQSLKIHILDSLGCAIGALAGAPIAMIGKQIDDFGGNPLASLIGGKKTAPDRAAFYNGALVRYLDYNDSFLAKKETCHPSDNLAPILAACEYANGSGKEFLTALALAYQVQCRLSEDAPVRDKGFDHTTQGAYSVAAGVSKSLRLNKIQTEHAIAIAAVPNNALRVTRTGALSHWKGLAFPNTAFSATHAAFLALRDITGPREVFEGNKGFIETISGPFKINWEEEKLDVLPRCILKKYNAEIHSQSAIEGILELRAAHLLQAADIERIEIDIFDVAFHIIGGGKEGSKKEVRTKEEADHSLPYMLAAAFLDGEVTPRQYAPERIIKKDIQDLLAKITIRPSAEFSKRFPNEMACHIQIFTQSGQVIEKEKRDYEGFTTRPMSWNHVLEKFNTLATPFASEMLRREISDLIYTIDEQKITTVTQVLRKIGKQHER